MDPITIGILATAAVSAISQYQNSQDAKKAAGKDQKKIQDIFDKLQAPAFDETGTPAPQYNMAQLTPEDYKVLQQYVPAAAQYVKEANPTVIKETADTQTGRSAQRDALTKLRDIATTGKDPAMQAKLLQASQAADRTAQQQTQSILQDENRRGFLGSGTALQARLSGSSDAMARSADQGTQSAIESYRNQLQAVRDSASLGGQLRDQDVSMQAKNADIMNAYNSRNARSQQDYENNRADTLNTGMRFNIGQNQDAANRNTAQNNAYAVNERNRNDTLARSGAEWAQSQKDALNQLRQRDFDNNKSVQLGRAGVLKDDQAMQWQNAGSKNQATAGVANAVTSGLMYKGSQDRSDARFDRLHPKPEDDEEEGDDTAGGSYGDYSNYG
jgi:hypothetical protein